MAAPPRGYPTRDPAISYPRNPVAHPPNPNDDLGRLVKFWRERLSPDEIPGLLSARSRRSTQVSQEVAATLIGCSVSWLRRLERGQEENYSSDFLDRVAVTYRLSLDEKTHLFLLATGHPPPVRDSASTLTVTPALQAILDAQPWPAYVNDEAWDIVAYNRHMSDWFPWVAGHHENNIMRWVFTYPEARRQLYRWITDWGPLMLAQLRFAHARIPDNPRLTQVLTEILERNPDARRFWDEQTTYMHPDGDHRSLYLPYHGDTVQPIELIALEPMRAPGSRIMMLLPLNAAGKV